MWKATKKPILESLSAEKLSRIMMRYLWGLYDAGGVSHGRSPEAFLLEAILDLIPYFLFCPPYSLVELEVRKRVKMGQVLSSSVRPVRLSRFHNIELARLAFWHLEERYKRPENEFLGGRSEVVLIGSLLGTSFLTKIIPAEDLLREVENRRHRKWHRAYVRRR